MLEVESALLNLRLRRRVRPVIILLMSRLLRRVFNVAAALSLLLCILLSTMWGLTYRGMNRLGCERNPPPFSGHARRSIDVDAMANRNSLLITIAKWSPDSASGLNKGGQTSSAPDRSRLFWERTTSHYILTLYPQYNANYCYYHLRSGVVTTTAGKGRGWVLRVGAPFFALIPFLLALPALWLARQLALQIRARRRARQGCCFVCNYDLRATPERCPECGAAAIARK